MRGKRSDSSAARKWTLNQFKRAGSAEQRGDRCRKWIEAQGDKVFRGGAFILVCNCDLWGFCLFYPFRTIISKKI